MGQGILTLFGTFVHYGIGNLTLLNTFVSIVNHETWNLAQYMAQLLAMFIMSYGI